MATQPAGGRRRQGGAAVALEACNVSVFVNVADETLATVVRATMGALVGDAASASAILITDDRDRDAGLPCLGAIEIVAPRPRCARCAVNRVLARQTHGIVLHDALESLVVAVWAYERGGVVFANRVLELSRRFPELTPRQDAVLCALARGDRTSDIEVSQRLSNSSIRRDVRAIEDILGVSGRAALAAAATSLGYSTRGEDVTS